jgi:cell division protein ZapA (FtsZ GTPase activity inhibitor)
MGRNGEGYFIFHSEEIEPNYFPITVNSDYKFSDDVLTALLITHEMTHVQQFIDSLNNNDRQSCREREVSAFISQLDFYVQLNNEENYAFYLRMNDERDNQHPQVEMIKAMIKINRESNCHIMDTECKNQNLRSKLFEQITSDPHYREQCGVI